MVRRNERGLPCNQFEGLGTWIEAAILPQSKGIPAVFGTSPPARCGLGRRHRYSCSSHRSWKESAMRGRMFIVFGVGRRSRGIDPGRALRDPYHCQVAVREVCLSRRVSGGHRRANSSAICGQERKTVTCAWTRAGFDCAICAASSRLRTPARHGFVKENLALKSGGFDEVRGRSV